MTLPTGTRLGPYEIADEIGAGGMGVVYRARDTRLGRDVAVKVLPAEFAADADRRARFEREAQAVAALSHPNILAIHDTGTHDGQLFVVTELLEGESLRDRLTGEDDSGVAVPARKAIQMSIQIARGLAAAHDKDLVHRDLKPDNVFLLSDGQVKILDFGLARHAEAGTSSGSSETVAAITDPGTAMGTVGYMAPEQVRGQPVDARTDLFAFGVVLYEMLSGRRAFVRDTNAETMTAILREDPPELARAVEGIPPGLVRLVQRCLEKNPAERFQSARDLAFHLSALSLDSGSGTASAAVDTISPAPRASRVPALAVTGAACLAAGLAFGWAIFRQAPTEPPRFQVLTYSGSAIHPATSPDGQTLAYSSLRNGVRQIWLRQMNGGGEAARTTGPNDFSPRFSPDGSQILYLRDEGGTVSLYRAPVVGGDERRVADNVTAADWSPDGSRIAVVDASDPPGAIGIVNADGGPTQELERLAGWSPLSVSWSPDGRQIAAALAPETGSSSPGIRIIPAAGGEGRFLTTPPLSILAVESRTVASGVAWSPSGEELIYTAADSAGSRVVAHDVARDEFRTLFWTVRMPSLLDVAGPGMLVYDAWTSAQNLQYVSLAGAPEPAAWWTQGNSVNRQPAFSPAGRHVIFSSTRSGNNDLWALSTADGTTRRLTDDDAADWDPAYTPDGESILWSSDRGGHYEIWMAAADGSGAHQVSQDGFDAENPTMTRDGQWIVYTSSNPDKRGIWKIRPDGRDAVLVVAGPLILPEVSPDGRFVAYLDNSAGEVRLLRVSRVVDGVEVFTTAVARNASSDTEFGRLRWMPDGRALVFLARNTAGVEGLFIQDFVEGEDTQSTRRPLAGFVPGTTMESFGIAPDGSTAVVSMVNTNVDIYLASGIPGLAARQDR